MADCLICTVGTSLITNALRGDDTVLKKHIENRNVQGAVEELLKCKPDEKKCGAEINSINSIIKKGHSRNCSKCIFLVSDSEKGKFTGAVLDLYISSGKSPLKFNESQYKVIEGLSDDDVNSFRNVGLKNLVRLISQQARFLNPENILINATGGYKAQISFAGIIGQALGIPVAYMHEFFPDVIILPPQPVNLDMNFWLSYGEEFFELNMGTNITEAHFTETDQRFEPLIESIDVDGKMLTALNVTGQLFHETFTGAFMQKKEDILPLACDMPAEKKDLTFEDSNKGKHKGLENYLAKIKREKFVKSITTNYYNKDLNETNRFRISSQCRPDQIEGVYSNDGVTTKFFISTTAENGFQRRACLNFLLNRLENGCY